MKNVSILKISKLLGVFITLFISLIIFAMPAQACVSGTCYENGISPNNPQDCGGSCPSNPCWKSSTDPNSYCRGHNVTGATTYGSTRTCTTDGYQTWSRTCQWCGTHFGSNTSVTQSRSDHDWSGWTNTGDADNHYSTCGNDWHDTSKDGVKTKSQPHTKIGADNWEEITSAAQIIRNATCTEWGQTKHKYQKGKSCTVCTWGSTDYEYRTHTDIPPLHHDMSNWTKIDNTTHKVTCSRSGCGHSHTENHTISNWMNSGSGYRYKDCIGSSTGFNCGNCSASSCSATGCSSHSHCTNKFCVVNDSNGCGAEEIRVEWYVLSLTLNGNGGTINNSATYGTTVTYGNTIKLPDSTTTKKSGYTFLGWGYHKYARLLIFKIKKRTY